MIRRERFLARLRELGFQAWRQEKVVELWRDEETSRVVFVPRKTLLAEEWVRRSLVRAGVSDEDALRFIGESR